MKEEERGGQKMQGDGKEIVLLDERIGKRRSEDAR